MPTKVGGWLLYAVYAQWRAVLRTRSAEGSAAVRRLYLYVAVFIGAVTTLTPTALVLRDLILRLLGGGLDSGSLLDDLVTPLSLIPVGLTIWLTVWRILQREADAYGEKRAFDPATAECALVVASAQTLERLDRRGLEALITHIEAGGAVVVFPRDGEDVNGPAVRAATMVHASSARRRGARRSRGGSAACTSRVSTGTHLNTCTPTPRGVSSKHCAPMVSMAHIRCFARARHRGSTPAAACSRSTCSAARGGPNVGRGTRSSCAW